MLNISNNQLIKSGTSNYSDNKNNNLKYNTPLANNNNTDSFDYSKNDGKISTKSKVKNLLKGVIAPVTTMFSSGKNLITGLSVIAAGGILIAATGGAAAPILVASGILGGAFQLGIGAYKASKAKTDFEAETAWQNIGSGTSSIVMSTIGAKSALKTSGTQTKGMNPIKATVECFKQLPKSFKKSYSSFRSGQAFNNLKTIFKAKNLKNKDNKEPNLTKNSESKQVSPIKDETKITTTQQKTNDYYKDDNIFGYDGDKNSAALRDEMRERILSEYKLTDEKLVVKTLDDAQKPQLKTDSKYYKLGEAKLNKRTNKYIHICENLKDMPDGDGLRGKTPLFGKNQKGLKFRLGKIKEAGIKRIIDLRAEGECSTAARNTIKEAGLDYVNFPIEDGNWNVENLKSITEYLNAIKAKDYYVGCANGQARTDLAVALNYILNPEAKSVPELYYGSTSSSRISVKKNILEIFDLIKTSPDTVKDWGWNSFEDFSSVSNKRLQSLLQTLNNM